MSQEDYTAEVASIHLSAAVPLEVEALRERGGPTETDRAWARECMDRMRHTGGGHGILYHDKGVTAQEMSYLTQALAVMAYVPGGVRFAGLHFDAEQPAFGLVLCNELLAELEPFRIAMEREEREARKLEDVSEQELARLRELEGELVRAADRGDTVQVALLEAEMDNILLVPVQVVQRVEAVGKAVQASLWEETA